MLVRHTGLTTRETTNMIRAVYIIAICLTTLMAAETSVEEETAEPTRSVPPAFPEGRPHPQRPSAVTDGAVPGAPDPDAPGLGVQAPPPTDADWLLRRMATSEDAAVRKRASEAWPVTEAAQETMDTLLRALADPSGEVRTGAVNRLAQLEATEVFGYVMRIMVGGVLEEVRAVDQALPAMESVLTPLMLETLRTELETPLHRRIAAYCLGRMGALRAVNTLGEYAWHGEDYALARTCVEALYTIGTPHTTPQWIMLLEHHDPYFRQLAVRALGAIGGAEAFARLRRLVLDTGEDRTLQAQALRALGDQPPAVLFPLLVDVLTENQQLRSTALRMLREQAGVDFGWDMNAWREWLNSLMHGQTPPLVPGR